MITIEIVSPYKAYVNTSNNEEALLIEKNTKFKNKSIEFQYRRHLKNRRWPSYDRPGWEAHGNALKEKIEKSVLFHEDGRLCIRPGYIPYLQEICDLQIENHIAYKKPRPYPWHSKPKEIPYPYQSVSVDKMVEQKHASVELCTGAGKSLIIVMLYQRLGLKTVVVTPSASIFHEMIERFTKHFGPSAVGALGDGKKKFGKNITVAISDSLSNLKPGTKEYDEIASADVVIGDESHTIPSETREEVFHGVLKNAQYRFFLSGTQTRGDGTEKLLHAIIGKTVHRLSTKEAIEGGYINDHSFKIIPVKANLQAASSGDALEMKRIHFLGNSNIVNFIDRLATAVFAVKQEKTLVLVDELSQIISLGRKLKVPYGVATSTTDKATILSILLTTAKTTIKDFLKAEGDSGLEKILEKMPTEDQILFYKLTNSDPTQSVEYFNKGKFPILIGTSCISTGTNIFPNHHTVNWQGGTSEVKTKQGAVGRSVRKLKGSAFEDFHPPKPKAIIYDFDVDNPTMTRHLKTRLKFYKDSGSMIEYLGRNTFNTDDNEEEIEGDE